MSIAPQFSNWESQQLVTAAEMLLYSNDVYQRLGIMSSIQPFIISGLNVSISDVGLVTVTAGSAVSPNMNHSDNPIVPAEGIQAIAVQQSQGTVPVGATGVEFGLIVLRQSLTSIENTPNYSVDSTLVYLPGSSTAYPEPGINDVPLIGVYTSGTSPSLAYDLDYGKRAVSTETYYQAIQGIDYFQNGSMQLWPFGTSEVQAAAIPVPVCENFSIYSTGLATPQDFTANRYVLSSEERALVPNSPQYGVTLARATPDATVAAFDCWEQRQGPYWLLNGKTLTRSFWIKATASEILNATLRVGYNPQDAEIVIPFIHPTQEIVADGVMRLYTFTYAVPELTDSLGTNGDNYISVKLCFSSIDQTYSAVVCEDHNIGGSFYVQPQSQAGQYVMSDIGKQEFGHWEVGNVGMGYIPFIEGTIGSPASSATISASLECSQYYAVLWNSTASNPTSAPVTGGRGSSAQADFAANKPMGLLRNAGMVFGNAGTGLTSQGISTSTREFGVPFGEEGHVQTIAELVPHTHIVPNTPNSGGGTFQGGSGYNANGIESESTGGGDPFNVIQPTNFVTVRIKL